MNEYIKVETLDNEFEARLLESILKERSIPHRLQSYHDTAFDGLYQTQMGWGHISSPEEHSREIREILIEIRKNADDAAEPE